MVLSRKSTGSSTEHKQHPPSRLAAHELQKIAEEATTRKEEERFAPSSIHPPTFVYIIHLINRRVIVMAVVVYIFHIKA